MLIYAVRMRRASKTGAAPANTAAPLLSPKAPLSSHPAFARDRGSTAVPSLKSNVTTGATTETGAVMTPSSTGATAGGEDVVETVEETVLFDRPNPYRYDKETFMSLWREASFVPVPEGMIHVWSESGLFPVTTLPLTELEHRVSVLFFHRLDYSKWLCE